jgi:hypothetical protein
LIVVSHRLTAQNIEMELTDPQKESLRKAREVIRELYYGYSVREMANRPEEVVASLNEILGENWSFHMGNYVKEK